MFSKNKSYTTESITWLNGSPLSFMSDLNSVWLLQVQYYCGHRTVSTPCENTFFFFATGIIMLCLLSHMVSCKRACGGLQNSFQVRTRGSDNRSPQGFLCVS